MQVNPDNSRAMSECVNTFIIQNEYTAVDYQQIENGNIANQIHGFTIDYGKFIVIRDSELLVHIISLQVIIEINKRGSGALAWQAQGGKQMNDPTRDQMELAVYLLQLD